MKCIIIAFSILLGGVILVSNGKTILANQQPSLKTEDLEEIRENMMEVRLALQKGDLIEALQHLNNVDEDLLLLETGLSSSDNVSGFSSSRIGDSASNSMAPEIFAEDETTGANYDHDNNITNNNNNNKSFDELQQNKALINNTTHSVSKKSLDRDNKSSLVNASKSEDSMQKLNVTFNSIFVNDDHDILFPAEWKLDGYVNNKRVQLSDNSGLDRVESGQVIDFNDKSVTIDVPENGSLRIATVGAEMDDGDIGGRNKNNQSTVYGGGDGTSETVLLDISGILDIEAPLPEYKDKVEDSVQFLTAYDRNDAIGIIAREFDARNSFGIGDHYDCSESTGEVGDLFDTVDTNCDYRLSYTIVER
jgi:hypothetical protein